MNPNYIVWACMAFALGIAATIDAFFIRDICRETKE